MVAADKGELGGVLRRARGVERLEWPVQFARRAELNGQRLLLVAHGPGRLAAEAASAALDRERVDAVVSVGFCGALDPHLRTGDIVVASRVDHVKESFDAAQPRCERVCHSGVVVSSDHVVGSVGEKAQLCAAGAQAVEMEAAGVAAQARKRGAPFYCVRVVLDGAAQGFSLDFNRLRDRQGRFSRPRIALAALARPFSAAPDVFRLERQGRIAARALGDFIADCRF